MATIYNNLGTVVKDETQPDVPHNEPDFMDYFRKNPEAFDGLKDEELLEFAAAEDKDALLYNKMKAMEEEKEAEVER